LDVARFYKQDNRSVKTGRFFICDNLLYNKHMAKQPVKNFLARFHLRDKSLYCFFALLIFCFIAFLLSGDFAVNASKNHKVSGFAWSENIGWVSLNCYNEEILNKCIQTDYGVDYDSNTGKLNGYAWSENVGWLCFGESCTGPSLPNLAVTPDGFAPQVRLSDHGLIDGWAAWTSIGADGWLKLLGPEVNLSGKKYACRNCALLKDESRERCGICFASEDFSGSQEICEACSNCVGNICYQCDKCYKYGVGIDYSNNMLIGWGWNGNGNGTGFGWLGFHPLESQAIINPPYLETIGGDVYGQKGVGSMYQGVTPEDSYNATYMVQSNGSIVHFSSECEATGQCGSADWVSDEVGLLNLPKQESAYQSELGLLDIKGMLAEQYGPVKKITAATFYDNYLKGNVYYSNHDLSVPAKVIYNGYSNYSGAGTIIVRGDLHVKGNQYYQLTSVNSLKKLASIGWIVIKNDDGGGGNIYIDPNVTKVVGSYFAEGTINTGTKGEGQIDKPLEVQGLMVAHEFKFQRNYSEQGLNESAERVIYDSRVISNPPLGFVDLAKALPKIKK